MIYTVFPVAGDYSPSDFPTRTEAEEHQEWLESSFGISSVIQTTEGECV